jgi:hypothetical protein
MRKLVLAAAVLSVTMLAAGSVAAAEPAEGPRCTMGEALANFEAPLQHFVSDDPSIRFKCQYRLWFDEREFTYCEDDVILGGTVFLAEYKALGWSREEGIADLERSRALVFIDGVEQQLMSTGYKDGQHPAFGKVVYVQYAFITQLPVGDYVSHYEEYLDGGLVFTATVQLHILPRTDALCS